MFLIPELIKTIASAVCSKLDVENFPRRNCYIFD